MNFLIGNADKTEEVNSLKSQLTNLSRENSTQKEQLDFYSKQLESLQAVKNELNLQVNILNDELNKTKSLSTKFLEVEKEKRVLMQENSGFYILTCLK